MAAYLGDPIGTLVIPEYVFQERIVLKSMIKYLHDWL